MNPLIMQQIMQAIGQSAPHILQGIFGNSGDPSRAAGREYANYYNKNIDAISGEKDPSAFINKLLGDYKTSDWAKNLTTQTNNQAMNMASASGLTGSTPLMNQMQQNSGRIASQDQDQWLGRVLGINKDYLDRYTGLTERQGGHAADAAYGQTLGKNYDRNQLLQGIAQLLFGNGGSGGSGSGYTGGQQFPAYLGN
jgi:hypothetical protein